jgi:hypothetical protein
VSVQWKSKRAQEGKNYILWSFNPISRHYTDYAILTQILLAPIMSKENKHDLIWKWGTLLVVQLVEALRYKPHGRGFDSRWWHWNFFTDIILPASS